MDFHFGPSRGLNLTDEFNETFFLPAHHYLFNYSAYNYDQEEPEMFSSNLTEQDPMADPEFLNMMDFNWTVLAKYLKHENKLKTENSSIVIVLGFLGNIAIVIAFLTNKVMLTTRNIFIANLAISDILLCTFTMPLTLVDLLTKYWTLGQQMEYLCKLIGTTQATCVFFSAFSIVLIAVDRYLFIVHPTSTQISTFQAFCLSGISLFLSTFLSSPLFFLTKLDVKKSLLTDETFSYCYESWEPEYSRVVYTCLCFSIQYLIPSITVGIVYTKVCQCLNRQSNVTQLSTHRRSRQMERRKKTNRMLITVTIIFFISWAPLNLFNIVIDLFEPFSNTDEDTRMMLMIFAFCHLSAMTSVCSNPIMYGFLNENFKQSLTAIVANCKCFQRLLQNRNRRTGESRSLIARNIGAGATNNNPPQSQRPCCMAKPNFIIPEIRFFNHRDSEDKLEMNLNFNRSPSPEEGNTATMVVRAGSELSLASSLVSPDNVETTQV